jgi:hypothetical protein
MGVAWIVAAPALVVERTGVFGAFTRSAQLTRGRRWPIFGVTILYVVAFGFVQQVFLNIAGATGASVATGASPLTVLPTQLPISAVLGVVASVVTAAGVAAIYYELRVTREGVGPEALAAIFD